MEKPRLITRNTLLACTRIRSGNAGGSGTVLYSSPKGSTYVLTNEHVVKNNIKIAKKWSSVLKRNIETDYLGTVEVHFFQYRWEQRAIGTTSVDADIVAYDKEEDLALLHLRTDSQVSSVAKLYPKGKESEIHIGEDITCIGAGLGEPPVVTKGIMSQFGREIDNKEYWLDTAPMIFGNSGGAVFITRTEEFIGVPARLPVIMMGFGADAITHLAYIIPITRVYKFLDDQMFRFIYDAKFTEEGEARERDQKRKEDETKLATQGIKEEARPDGR